MGALAGARMVLRRREYAVGELERAGAREDEAALRRCFGELGARPGTFQPFTTPLAAPRLAQCLMLGCANACARRARTWVDNRMIVHIVHSSRVSACKIETMRQIRCFASS